MRRRYPAVGLFLSLCLAWGCGESVGLGTTRGTTLSVSAIRTANDSLIDSVQISVSQDDGTAIGSGSAHFPAGVNTVPVQVTVSLSTQIEDVQVRIDLLANGQVVFTRTARVTIRRGESSEVPGISPAVWDSLSPSSGPAPRFGAGMVLTAGSPLRYVLFGGAVRNQPGNDTWEYLNGSWRLVVTDSNPPARVGAVMVWDDNAGKVILFGGAGATGELNDTWAYDGANWVRVPTATSPPPRTGAAGIWDPAGGVTIFGGAAASATLNDTWSF